MPSENAMSSMTQDMLSVILALLIGVVALVATWRTSHRVEGLIFFAFGVVSTLFGLYLFSHAIVPGLDILIALMTRPIFLIPCFLLAVLLYRLRGTNPFVYGVLEVLIGSFVTAFVIATPGGDLNAKLVGVVGGIYIVVRGMDNADKGMPDRIRPIWAAIFPKASTQFEQDRTLSKK